MVGEKITKELDCIGLFCPEPLFETRSSIDEIDEGEVLHVMADDPASEEDIARFCKRTGHELLKLENKDGIFHFYIKKQ